MPAFVARPSEAGRYPVIVLMHERYGLVEHTEHLAERCASDGFVVVAGNFFFEHPDQAGLADGSARCDLSDPDAVRLIQSAFDAMKDDPQADLQRTAVAGYCQTGRHPLVYAAQHSPTAVVLWYGGAGRKEWPVSEIHPEPFEDVVAKVRCPVFAAYGDKDHIIAVENVRKLRGIFEDNLTSYDINIYQGAPHGWLNSTMPGRYRKMQADAAWSDQQRFLAANLSPERKTDTVSWSFNAVVSADYDFSKNVRLE
jgi:carboxymethylenebutenolidase